MKINPDADFEYKTSFAKVAEDFPQHSILVDQLKDLNPVPPKGKNWRLHGAVVREDIIFFIWERKRLDFSDKSTFSGYSDRSAGLPSRSEFFPDEDDNRGNK